VAEGESFSVVVPTYQRPEALAQTLAALLDMDAPPAGYEVIVVDDGQDEDTRQVVHEARAAIATEVTYIGQATSGAATARNRGARRADGNILLFCDDDIIVRSDHLLRQLAARADFEEPLVNGVLQFSPAAFDVLRRTPFGRYRIELDRRYQREADGPSLGDGRYEARLVSACNLAIRREAFWELGGFDEAFPYAGAEDQALSLAARAKGFRLVRDHEIEVLHNDQTLTVTQFCRREERSAQTFVVLAARFPTEAERPLFAANTPVSRRDSLPMVAKKVAKALLGRWPILPGLHALARACERSRVSDAILRRYYDALVGVHIHRGVRAALRRMQ